MKRIIGNILANLSIAVGFAIIIQLIVYFVWNTAVLWAVPQLEPIGYGIAFGIATLFCVLNYATDFWLRRIAEIRKVKSLITLDLLSNTQLQIVNLQEQILVMKAILINKGVLTIEEAISQKDDTP